MDGREVLADRYEVRGLLGRGGMAEVYDGWDLRLNRAVAIKLLHPGVGSDAEARRRFDAEARAAAALNHPNIVAVHDYGEHNGTPFIVMERLPGRTLADEVEMGPMAPGRVRAMLDDVLGALACAHAAGIVHRDVKPGNVLLAQSNTMKVADFGIAKANGTANTATGQIVGTMAYMVRPVWQARRPQSLMTSTRSASWATKHSSGGDRSLKTIPCRYFEPYWTIRRHPSKRCGATSILRCQP